MEILDVSVAVRPGMVVWPGDPAVRVELASAIAEGAEANLTRLELGAHTGTHVDAPVHFLEGAAGAEALPLDALVGPCVVVDATGARGELGPEALDGVASGVERVLWLPCARGAGRPRPDRARRGTAPRRGRGAVD